MCDVTIVTMLADSYVDTAVTGAGLVAEMAAGTKLDKYSTMLSNYIIKLVAVNE